MKKSDSSKDDIKGTLHIPFDHLSAFHEFYHGLKRNNRFIPLPNAQNLIDELITFAFSHRLSKINKGSYFFRARINPNQDIKKHKPLPKSKMSAPPFDLAVSGRLNPKGIPYLYLSNNRDTAVAEVRPWVHAQITVAKIILMKDIKIIDFLNETPVGRYPGATFLGSESGAETIWRELLSYIISLPLQPNDSVSYVPTQYFAESLKAKGIEGIKYRSSLNPGGTNIAIFNPLVGRVTSTRLMEVSEIKYSVKFSDELK